MVVQVAADARHVLDHRDAVLVQVLRWPYARQHQQLRRAVDAARDDDLAVGARRLEAVGRAVFDADGAAVLDQHAGGVRRGGDGEVLALLRLAQIGPRARPASRLADGGLVEAHAFLGPAVEVGIGRDAGLLGRFVHGLGQGRLPAMVGDFQRPADAVELVGAALLVLGALEIGQDRIVVPALAAALAPFVVVSRIAAHVDHAVDRAGAAQDLASRLVHDAVVELGLGLGVEHPVDARIVERLVVAERDVDPGIAVLGPGLEQQHAVAAVLAETSGHGTAGRAGSGHDEIVRFALHHAPPAFLRGA